MRNELTVQIASVPDRDGLVAEIWHGDVMVAEINQGQGRSLRVELYPSPRDAHWDFDLDDLIGALAEARRRLLP